MRSPALLRQLTRDRRGLAAAARSERSERLQARDGHRRPHGPVSLPLLRRRVRAARLREGRRGGADRGRPRLADLAWAAVPARILLEEPRDQPHPAHEDSLPAPPSARLGGPRPRYGYGHDRRPGDRDPRRTWEETADDGTPLRRTLGFAHLGGATLDNEENYLIKKLFTALGAVQIENQARI